MVIVVEIANQGRGGRIQSLMLFKSEENKSIYLSPEQQNI